MKARRVSAELIDRLAGEYVLGTLRGGARRRFETAMRSDADVERAVLRWQQRLMPLDDKLAPVRGGAALWARIESRAFGAAASRAAEAEARPWWQRLFGAIPAGALALGLLLGSVGPVLWRAQTSSGDSDGETQLPQSYIGVLARPDGRQGMLVSSLRRGRTVDLKQLAVQPLPPGRTLFLWAIDAAGRTTAIGAIPNRPFASITLPQPAEALFSTAVELAVSLEADGAAVLPQPSQPYVYRGLCGKLWPAPPPAAASR